MLIIMCTAICGWAWIQQTLAIAAAPVAILKVDTSRPTNEFALGTVGLSLEAGELRTPHFDSSHYRLVRLMRLLGPAVLRIGGNSVDLSWWTSKDEPAPPWATNTITPADLYALAGLVRATGWRVLLGVDLGHFDPVRAADEARYAHEILGPTLVGLEIGNEPNFYSGPMHRLRAPSYNINDYLREAEAYRQVLSVAAPEVPIYGPAFSGISWLTQLGAAASAYSVITQHYYPNTTCPNSPPSPSGTLTTDGLLSFTARQSEQETLTALQRLGAAANRPTMIGETNDVACGGGSTVGPLFASALWAMDWSLRAASSGVVGVDFHGQLGSCGSDTDSPLCAPTAGGGRTGDIQAQPEYYGLLAARQLEGGRFVPTRFVVPGQPSSLTAWATVSRAECLDSQSTISL